MLVNMCIHVYVHRRAHGMCVRMCIDMRIGMCIGMCIDMCIGMRIDMCTNMRTDMCVDLWLFCENTSSISFPRSRPTSSTFLSASVQTCVQTKVCGQSFEYVHGHLCRPVQGRIRGHDYKHCLCTCSGTYMHKSSVHMSMHTSIHMCVYTPEHMSIHMSINTRI